MFLLPRRAHVDVILVLVISNCQRIPLIGGPLLLEFFCCLIVIATDKRPDFTAPALQTKGQLYHGCACDNRSQEGHIIPNA